MKKKVSEWLNDESNKKKQDDSTIKILLRKDFESRRQVISSLAETNGDLVAKVLDLYPIFKNYRYVRKFIQLLVNSLLVCYFLSYLLGVVNFWKDVY